MGINYAPYSADSSTTEDHKIGLSKTVTEPLLIHSLLAGDVNVKTAASTVLPQFRNAPVKFQSHGLPKFTPRITCGVNEESVFPISMASEYVKQDHENSFDARTARRMNLDESFDSALRRMLGVCPCCMSGSGTHLAGTQGLGQERNEGGENNLRTLVGPPTKVI